MEAKYVERLSRVKEYSNELLETLNFMIKEIHNPGWDNYSAKIATILVNLNSKPKPASNTKTVGSGSHTTSERAHHAYCQDLILVLLLKLIE